MYMRIAGAVVALAAAGFVTADDKAGTDGISVDKAKKTVTVDAVVSPREVLKDGSGKFQIYPIEVFACASKDAGGQKAHETVVNVAAKPSAVHKALTDLGLKPGKPGLVGRNKPEGPEVKLFLEWEADGKTQRVPAEDCVVNVKTGKTIGSAAGFKWLFTGSAMVNPDPEKDDLVYGADTFKTLVGIYSVTDSLVIQTNQEEGAGQKLEVAKNVPKIGTKVKLVIQVP